MQIYTKNDCLNLNKTAVTLGKFNGIHKGHQKLINHLMQEKIENGYETVLFSFDTTPHKPQVSLTTKREQAILCEKFGIDHLVIYPVTKQTMAMSPQDFIKNILVEQLGAKVIVTGCDFRFGKNRAGDINLLEDYSKQYGYHLVVESSMMYHGEKISSTNIKRCISNGKLKDAENMLGYPYFITGKIIKGRQIGRTMGIRTINMEVDFEKMLLPNGVYATKTLIYNKQYRSITNIGYCPTVSDNHFITVETNVFDFDENVYDCEAIVSFDEFIREEKKFQSIDELKAQIQHDILVVKSL